MAIGGSWTPRLGGGGWTPRGSRSASRETTSKTVSPPSSAGIFGSSTTWSDGRSRAVVATNYRYADAQGPAPPKISNDSFMLAHATRTAAQGSARLSARSVRPLSARAPQLDATALSMHKGVRHPSYVVDPLTGQAFVSSPPKQQTVEGGVLTALADLGRKAAAPRPSNVPLLAVPSAAAWGGPGRAGSVSRSTCRQPQSKQ